MVSFFGGACHGRQGERGEELRPNAVYAHDPVLIPEQARGNMAACTTTEGGGLGREMVRSLFGSTRLFPTCHWRPRFFQVGETQVRCHQGFSVFQENVPHFIVLNQTCRTYSQPKLTPDGLFFFFVKVYTGILKFKPQGPQSPEFLCLAFSQLACKCISLIHDIIWLMHCYFVLWPVL